MRTRSRLAPVGRKGSRSVGPLRESHWWLGRPGFRTPYRALGKPSRPCRLLSLADTVQGRLAQRERRSFREGERMRGGCARWGRSLFREGNAGGFQAVVRDPVMRRGSCSSSSRAGGFGSDLPDADDSAGAIRCRADDTCACWRASQSLSRSPAARSRSNCPVAIQWWIVRRLIPKRLNSSAFDTPWSR